MLSPVPRARQSDDAKGGRRSPAEGPPPKRPPLAVGETYSGNAAGDFVAAAPVAFLAAPAS